MTAQRQEAINSPSQRQDTYIYHVYLYECNYLCAYVLLPPPAPFISLLFLLHHHFFPSEGPTLATSLGPAWLVAYTMRVATCTCEGREAA